MSIKARRKIHRIGGSKAIFFDNKLIGTSKEATMVYDRLILADPRAEISEDDLQEFFEERIEPEFWKWHVEKLRQKKESQQNANQLSPTNP